MNLEDRAIDDLHNDATYLFQHEPHALALLNDVYASLLREYIEALKLLRDREAPPHRRRLRP